MAAMANVGDLDSSATTLEGIIQRITAAIDQADEHDDQSIALMEVERSLRSAHRRLLRVVREARTR